MFQFQRFSRSRAARLTLPLLVIALLLLYLPVTIQVYPESDFVLHTLFVESLRTNSTLDGHIGEVYHDISYPVYHVIVAVLTQLTQPPPYPESLLNAQQAGILTTVLIHIINGMAVYVLICGASPFYIRTRTALLYAGLAIGLVLIEPILLFNLHLRDLLSGYVHTSVYHNPTSIILRPVGLLLMLLSTQVFRKLKVTWQLIFLTACVAVLTLLSKPSLTIALLPALVLMSGMYVLLKQPVNWRLLIAGLIVPSVVVLLIQYSITFDPTNESTIALEPFTLILSLSGDFTMLIIKLLLSLAFPLVIVGLYLRQAMQDHFVMLSWMTTLVALAYFYLLVEHGPKYGHVNFQWGATMAIYVLYISSLLFFIRQRGTAIRDNTANWRDWLSLVVLALHIISGFLFYFAHLTVVPFHDIL